MPTLLTDRVGTWWSEWVYVGNILQVGALVIFTPPKWVESEKVGKYNLRVRICEELGTNPKPCRSSGNAWVILNLNSVTVLCLNF